MYIILNNTEMTGMGEMSQHTRKGTWFADSNDGQFDKKFYVYKTDDTECIQFSTLKKAESYVESVLGIAG